MTKPISALTYKVVAFSELQEVDTNECIDWANEMIELGYDSPSLYMLAATEKPTNYFEIIDYLKSTVQELGLEMKTGDAATLSYASYYVEQIAEEKDIRENLTFLYKFCQIRDYEELVNDFYMLYWAWDQLDYADDNNNHYWPGITRQNIKETVIKVANDWIAMNKKYYAQQ
ncbi:hypothetical protein [Parvicella tangerina]|uniref:Uncharacterized protein n=1 Tax=Parvicella tangerina TaxID=2829795 RepID=A0A916JMP7_9FLAO|nr:hypothetical protein [Parvicella tangerina]CAG5082415.1 hypothetical protein CRYO30217_01910 [Parvicella tangerina]